MTAVTNGIRRPSGTKMVVRVVFTTKGCISDESRHMTTAFAESLLPVLTSISIHCMLGIAAGHRPLVAVDTSGTDHRKVGLDRRIRSSDDHMHHAFERIANAHSCRGPDDADPQVDESNLSRSGLPQGSSRHRGIGDNFYQVSSLAPVTSMSMELLTVDAAVVDRRRGYHSSTFPHTKGPFGHNAGRAHYRLAVVCTDSAIRWHDRRIPKTLHIAPLAAEPIRFLHREHQMSRLLTKHGTRTSRLKGSESTLTSMACREVVVHP